MAIVLKEVFIIAGQNTQLSQSWDECPRIYTSEGVGIVKTALLV